MNYSIKLNRITSENEINMCESKFWGSPDMPESFSFPTYKDEIGDESVYEFICQINCRDIIKFDTDNLLPHKGMLYFFARLGYYIGNFFPDKPFKIGKNEQQACKVIYTPREDYENFLAMTLVDDDDEEIEFPAQQIHFEKSSPLLNSDSKDYIKLLGDADCNEKKVEILKENESLLFQISSCMIDAEVDLTFPENGILSFIIPSDDLTKNKTFKNVYPDFRNIDK